jgi:hypothetical protein
MVAPSASAAVPSASATPQSDLLTQLSASAVTSARVVSCLIETRRAGCAVRCGRSDRQTDGRTNVMCCRAGASFCCWLLDRNDGALSSDHY